MLFRLIKGAIKLIVTLAVLAVLAGGYLFYRALPSYSGQEKLPGLSADVRVWRDGHGIPHIFAANMTDAARALGYLHASERLYQMEVNRRVGQGRISEMAGAEEIGVDKFIRTLGFYRQAQSSYNALSKDAQARLDAYADGVNAYLKAHEGALPVEFLLTGVTPEPWKPADSLVWLKLMSWQLSRNHAQEVTRAELAAKLPAEQASWLMPSLAEHAPITTMPEYHPDHASLDDPELKLSKWIPFRHGASNQWAVAGSRTTTGKPILANDPHLEIGAPSLWYLVRIDTPDETLVGASVPGLPIVLLGRNKQIAWGITSSQTDTQDLFIESVDPANADNYLTPDGSKPFDAHDETIHVKGGADVDAAHSRHKARPCDVRRLEGFRQGRRPQSGRVALPSRASAATTRRFEAVLKIDSARNWGEFTEALKLVFAPMQNIGYADVNGDIGLISPARVPVRKSGDGLAPTSGATGATDWTGWVPFEDMPQIHNPDVGFVFNANNPLVPEAKEAIFGRDWDEPFRARRLQQFFNQIDKHSLETSAQMQADNLSLDAVEFLPLLKALKPSDERGRQALSLLAAGTPCSTRTSPNR